MTDPVSIHTALARVMEDLPAIGKGGQASAQQGGYSYRGIEQITREVQRLFARHGVVVVPFVQSMKVVDIQVQSKPWTDTILEVEYTLTGPDGSKLTARTVGVGRDSSDKGANKAMTQAFKYLLLQVLCISDAKDDPDGSTHEADGQRAQRRRPAPQEPTGDVLSDAQMRKLRALYGAVGIDGAAHQKTVTAALLDVPQVATHSTLTPAQASTVINALVEVEAGRATFTLDADGNVTGIKEAT